MIPDIPTLATSVAALAVVLALVLCAARLARFGGFPTRTAGNRVLSIEETVALDSRRRLHLVRCADRRVLLMTGGGSDTVVGWLPEQENA